jgi:hypothetical protein
MSPNFLFLSLQMDYLSLIFINSVLYILPAKSIWYVHFDVDNSEDRAGS